MELTKVVAVRLPTETARRIEQMAARDQVNQSIILRGIILKALAEKAAKSESV